MIKLFEKFQVRGKFTDFEKDRLKMNEIIIFKYQYDERLRIVKVFKMSKSTSKVEVMKVEDLQKFSIYDIYYYHFDDFIMNNEYGKNIEKILYRTYDEKDAFEFLEMHYNTQKYNL